jgi:hypothetical protein
MPVKVKPVGTVFVNNEKVVAPLVSISNIVTVVCDFENCRKEHFNPETRDKVRKTVEWDELNPESMTDDFWKLLTLQNSNNEKLVFCSAGCVVKYLQTVYKPLKNPNKAQDNLIEFPSKQIPIDFPEAQ